MTPSTIDSRVLGTTSIAVITSRVSGIRCGMTCISCDSHSAATATAAASVGSSTSERSGVFSVRPSSVTAKRPLPSDAGATSACL
jgi:hypothetical protein|eukprot:COSAG06_NODE_2060_length_7699_cov_21.717105_2_plen_85_part_00